MDKTIFVSITSFKDLDVINTVRDLFQNAASPQRITVGVVLQEDESQLHLYEELGRHKNVKLVAYPVEWAEGCGKARFEAVKLFDGQNFFFQLDSHMRFDYAWDELLVSEIKQCKADRPILTTLPPSFDLLTGKKDPPAYNQLVLREFFNNIPQHVGRSVPMDRFTPPAHPQQTPFLAGGVMFTSGTVCGTKPDPYFYFHGEEFMFNLRLWTRGFTNFSPRFNFCYHEYRHPHMKRTTIRDLDPLKDLRLHERSMSRYQVLLGLKKRSEVPAQHLIDLERYQLGEARTVKDWEDRYKISIREETASPEAYP